MRLALKLLQNAQVFLPLEKAFILMGVQKVVISAPSADANVCNGCESWMQNLQI